MAYADAVASLDKSYKHENFEIDVSKIMGVQLLGKLQ